jgi:hypothetical protein
MTGVATTIALAKEKTSRARPPHGRKMQHHRVPAMPGRDRQRAHRLRQVGARQGGDRRREHLVGRLICHRQALGAVLEDPRHQALEQGVGIDHLAAEAKDGRRQPHQFESLRGGPRTLHGKPAAEQPRAGEMRSQAIERGDGAGFDRPLREGPLAMDDGHVPGGAGIAVATALP